MKRFLLSLLCMPALLFSDVNLDDWVNIKEIYVSKNTPTQEQALFVNSYTEVGPVAGEWHTIDLSDKVPAGTKAVFLSGILLITRGAVEEIADMHLFFRRYGSQDDSIYTAQVIESLFTGQRSPFSVWVPVSEDLKFEFKWTRTNYAQWPEYSAYGINLSINAFGM